MWHYTFNANRKWHVPKLSRFRQKAHRQTIGVLNLPNLPTRGPARCGATFRKTTTKLTRLTNFRMITTTSNQESKSGERFRDREKTLRTAKTIVTNDQKQTTDKQKEDTTPRETSRAKATTLSMPVLETNSSTDFMAKATQKRLTGIKLSRKKGPKELLEFLDKLEKSEKDSISAGDQNGELPFLHDPIALAVAISALGKAVTGPRGAPSMELAAQMAERYTEAWWGLCDNSRTKTNTDTEGEQQHQQRELLMKPWDICHVMEGHTRLRKAPDFHLFVSMIKTLGQWLDGAGPHTITVAFASGEIRRTMNLFDNEKRNQLSSIAKQFFWFGFIDRSNFSSDELLALSRTQKEASPAAQQFLANCDAISLSNFLRSLSELRFTPSQEFLLHLGSCPSILHKNNNKNQKTVEPPNSAIDRLLLHQSCPPPHQLKLIGALGGLAGFVPSFDLIRMLVNPSTIEMFMRTADLVDIGLYLVALARFSKASQELATIFIAAKKGTKPNSRANQVVDNSDGSSKLEGNAPVEFHVSEGLSSIVLQLEERVLEYAAALSPLASWGNKNHQNERNKSNASAMDRFEGFSTLIFGLGKLRLHPSQNVTQFIHHEQHWMEFFRTSSFEGIKLQTELAAVRKNHPDWEERQEQLVNNVLEKGTVNDQKAGKLLHFLLDGFYRLHFTQVPHTFVTQLVSKEFLVRFVLTLPSRQVGPLIYVLFRLNVKVPSHFWEAFLFPRVLQSVAHQSSPTDIALFLSGIVGISGTSQRHHFELHDVLYEKQYFWNDLASPKVMTRLMENPLDNSLGRVLLGLSKLRQTLPPQSIHRLQSGNYIEMLHNFVGPKSHTNYIVKSGVHQKVAVSFATFLYATSGLGVHNEMVFQPLDKYPELPELCFPYANLRTIISVINGIQSLKKRGKGNLPFKPLQRGISAWFFSPHRKPIQPNELGNFLRSLSNIKFSLEYRKFVPEFLNAKTTLLSFLRQATPHDVNGLVAYLTSDSSISIRKIANDDLFAGILYHAEKSVRAGVSIEQAPEQERKRLIEKVSQARSLTKQEELLNGTFATSLQLLNFCYWANHSYRERAKEKFTSLYKRPLVQQSFVSHLATWPNQSIVLHFLWLCQAMGSGVSLANPSILQIAINPKMVEALNRKHCRFVVVLLQAAWDLQQALYMKRNLEDNDDTPKAKMNWGDGNVNDFTTLPTKEQIDEQLPLNVVLFVKEEHLFERLKAGNDPHLLTEAGKLIKSLIEFDEAE